MKIKKIIIKSQKEFFQEARDWARASDKGEKVKPLIGEYFESLDAVRIFLTEKRLEIWRTIRDKEPKSLTELARFVDRDYKDVYQDVSILVGVGLVELVKPKGATTRALKPVSLADQIELKVA